jgi:hypothetical protein
MERGQRGLAFVTFPSLILESPGRLENFSSSKEAAMTKPPKESRKRLLGSDPRGLGIVTESWHCS